MRNFKKKFLSIVILIISSINVVKEIKANKNRLKKNAISNSSTSFWEEMEITKRLRDVGLACGVSSFLWSALNFDKIKSLFSNNVCRHGINTKFKRCCSCDSEFYHSLDLEIKEMIRNKNEKIHKYECEFYVGPSAFGGYIHSRINNLDERRLGETTRIRWQNFHKKKSYKKISFYFNKDVVEALEETYGKPSEISKLLKIMSECKSSEPLELTISQVLYLEYEIFLINIIIAEANKIGHSKEIYLDILKNHPYSYIDGLLKSIRHDINEYNDRLKRSPIRKNRSNDKICDTNLIKMNLHKMFGTHGTLNSSTTKFKYHNRTLQYVNEEERSTSSDLIEAVNEGIFSEFFFAIRFCSVSDFKRIFKAISENNCSQIISLHEEFSFKHNFKDFLYFITQYNAYFLGDKASCEFLGIDKKSCSDLFGIAQRFERMFEENWKPEFSNLSFNQKLDKVRNSDENLFNQQIFKNVIFQKIKNKYEKVKKEIDDYKKDKKFQSVNFKFKFPETSYNMNPTYQAICFDTNDKKTVSKLDNSNFAISILPFTQDTPHVLESSFHAIKDLISKDVEIASLVYVENPYELIFHHMCNKVTDSLLVPTIIICFPNFKDFPKIVEAIEGKLIKDNFQKRTMPILNRFRIYTSDNKPTNLFTNFHNPFSFSKFFSTVNEPLNEKVLAFMKESNSCGKIPFYLKSNFPGDEFISDDFTKIKERMSSEKNRVLDMLLSYFERHLDNMSLLRHIIRCPQGEKTQL
ncbi:MAG: hypothetical protein FWC41_03645 [Firmicutes bacterium]|nr:hypothetical protein [Bacillota bacterium]